ncbi:MAG: hypothetical protein ACFCUQ_18940 [Kiloniellales bacterium]
MLETLTLLVGTSGALATFVASVMAEEQNDRLRNGTLGAVAGSSIGGLAALLKDSPELLIVGAFGSAVGAFLGWLVYLLLSFIASTERGRPIFEYHVGGLKGVREQLRLDNKELVLKALDQWKQSFGGLVSKQKTDLLNTENGDARDHSMQMVITSWLTITTDVFNFVFGVLAKEPQYRVRATIIVYGASKGDIVGRHWISYAGSLPRHRTKSFDKNSVGYKVLTEEFPSPHFTPITTAVKEGQDRGEVSYHSFFAFRITDFAILSVDWPGQLDVNDAYVEVARDLYHRLVIPAIMDLLSGWSQPVQKCLGLEPLPDQHSVAIPNSMQPGK